MEENLSQAPKHQMVRAEAPVVAAASGFDTAKLMADLKTELMPGIEAEAKKAVNVIFAWAKLSLQNHPNTYLKFVIPVLEVVQPMAISWLDKVDNK